MVFANTPKSEIALAVERTDISVLIALGVWWGREQWSGEG